MARLRVFVSSTCYDLSVVRNQLRAFIEGQGHEPVMSDYNDVLYDPRHHTHTSCINEIVSCDVVVVIIGSRHGGVSIPEALERVNIDALITSSSSVDALKTKENISITQLEVLKAIEESIPIFTFVDDRVWNDHGTYEKNKMKSIIDEMEFASIEKPKTARYIFEFINFLRHRSNNNGLTPFGKYSDLEIALGQQWSGFFKQLLNEQRQRTGEIRRIDALTEQFEDLKAAMLATIGDDTRRKIARGVVQFRRLFDFLNAASQFAGPVAQYAREDNWTWQKILNRLDVVEVMEVKREFWWDLLGTIKTGPRATAFLKKADDKIFVLYFPLTLKNIATDLDEFMGLSKDNREIIWEALLESQSTLRRPIAFTDMDIATYVKSLANPRDDKEPGGTPAAD